MSSLQEENSYRFIIFGPLSRVGNNTIIVIDIFADELNKQNNRIDASFFEFGLFYTLANKKQTKKSAG